MTIPTNNSVRQAVDHAEKFNDTIGLFMRSVGVGGQPVGIRGVYDKWIPYLRTEKPTHTKIKEFGSELKAEIEVLAHDAVGLGDSYAKEQLSFYDIELAHVDEIEEAVSAVMFPAIDSVYSKFLSQQSAAELFIALGYPVEMIVGNAAETGVFSPSATVKTAISAFLALLWASTDLLFSSSIRDQYQYDKIAVAAVDTKTTECCLKVHGQVQPLDKPFILTGEPRFADRIDFPPFHWYCRTATALYIREFDYGNIKAELEASAQAILRERALGLQVPRAPVSGVS